MSTFRSKLVLGSKLQWNRCLLLCALPGCKYTKGTDSLSTFCSQPSGLWQTAASKAWRKHGPFPCFKIVWKPILSQKCFPKEHLPAILAVSVNHLQSFLPASFLQQDIWLWQATSFAFTGALVPWVCYSVWHICLSVADVDLRCISSLSLSYTIQNGCAVLLPHPFSFSLSPMPIFFGDDTLRMLNDTNRVCIKTS